MKVDDYMEKVFLYLYPVKEYFMHFANDDEVFKKLNETIKQRYKKNGFKVICAIYPDKKIFGINDELIDKKIITDISFNEHTTQNENGEYIYPSEELLLQNLLDSSELVIGGFHYSDCVKRVGEKALELGINCFVDLDLTDLFFNLYNTEYFNVDSYEPNRFKEYMLKKMSRFGDELSKEIFERNYSSPVYRMNQNQYKKSM